MADSNDSQADSQADTQADKPAADAAANAADKPAATPADPHAANLMAKAIRALAMDAVEKANSGHPGAPMGMADMAVAVWGRHLRHNPANPSWANRDRFVLSNGHASMLLYALLHLTGYELPMSEIENFRQLHSKTPGHPEHELTVGVETTTGPLGQGFSNAVGMALAEKLLAKEFNRQDGDTRHEIVDHRTYVFLGDGCMMEGISHESAALAGAWKLGKLVALYDSNGISIDGKVAPWFIDDTPERFRAYGWNVIPDVDGHDADAIDEAIRQALAQGTGTGPGGGRPTLICCRTVIGQGSPNRGGTAKAHGEALGEKEVALTREAIGWKEPPFSIPERVYALWDAKSKGLREEGDWKEAFSAYEKAFPDLAAEFMRRTRGDLPPAWGEIVAGAVADADAKKEKVATRKASQLALEVFTKALPELLGGSADLTGSNLTNTTSTPPFRLEDDGSSNGGRHINYGVREFGMVGAMNGLSVHGGLMPYGGTFLTFSDYCRNGVRMAALMKQRVMYVFTHDSIGLGEDGPTHQSIEHAWSLRIIPNLDVWRPCDTAESVVAWASAIERRHGPSALLFSRQAVPYLAKRSHDGIARGGYVMAEPSDAGVDKPAELVLIATGTEVQLAVAAQKAFAAEGVAVRVVSMPSTSVFDRQDDAYKREVLMLDGHPKRVAIEMGVSDGWYKYKCDAVIGIDRYGESGKAEELFAFFGFTPEKVVETLRGVMKA